MINMAHGLDKGQSGKSMYWFEAITTHDIAPPAELEFPWILAEQEIVSLTLHDNNINVFITSLFTCGFVPNTWISCEYSTIAGYITLKVYCMH